VPAYAGTPAGTVVVRASGLRVRGGTATAGGGAAPAAGELAVFCRPVVTAPAVVRRDGTVLADAWLPDLVRLGELERHLGDGVIEAIVDEAVAAGRLRPRQQRRLMSYPLVIRLMIAMVLMPDGSYCEALARLAGLLADIPFTLEWHVPTEKVVTGWRVLVPADVMEDLFWQAAGPLIADDEPSAVLLAGMAVLAADGMLVNLADTPANRAMSGSAGTAGDSSPFPQLRIVALAARAGRAMPGAILGSSRAGEQTLLKRLARRRPELFAGRVTCFDRNFPGYDLITAILDAGGHVVARVSATVALPLAEGGGWLARRITDDLAERPVREEAGPAAGPRRRAQRHPALRRRERSLRDLHRHHYPAGPPGRARRPGPGNLPHQVERIGDHVRGGQDDDHRRREPHLRPGPAVGVPAAGHLRSLGLAHRDPARPCQRGRRAARRARRRPCPAPQRRRPGHRRRGILHRRSPPPHHWTRSPPRRTPPPARACTPSTSPAGSATPDARRKHARNSRTPPPPRRPSPGNPRSPYSPPASASRRQESKPSGRRNRPRPRGPRTVDRAPDPPRHAGSSHDLTPATPSRKRTREQARNTRTETPLDNLKT
jgi:hypothetical protein